MELMVFDYYNECVENTWQNNDEIAMKFAQD